MRDSGAVRSGVPDVPEVRLGFRVLALMPLGLLLLGLSTPLQAQAGPPETLGPPQWHLIEELSFLVIDPSETAFPDIRDIVVDPEGRMYLGLYHLRSIRAFDPDGRFLTAFGSPGSAEGQMTGLQHLGRLGDTIVAIDARRAVFFGPDGTPRGDLWATRSLSGSEPRFERLLPDGNALFRQRRELPEPPEGSGEASSDTPDRLLLFGPRDGSTLDTLVVLPAPEPPPEFQIERGGRTLGWNSPYVFGPLHDVASNGSAAAIVRRPRAEAGEEAVWELVVIETPTGDTLVDRRYPYAPEPVDADEVIRALAEGFASAFDLPPEELEPEIRQEITLPDAAPPLTEVHVADHGAIWVRLWHTPGAASNWRVLNEVGDPVARVELPARAEIVRIEPDALYATARWRCSRAGALPDGAQGEPVALRVGVVAREVVAACNGGRSRALRAARTSPEPRESRGPRPPRACRARSA